MGRRFYRPPYINESEVVIMNNIVFTVNTSNGIEYLGDLLHPVKEEPKVPYIRKFARHPEIKTYDNKERKNLKY